MEKFLGAGGAGEVFLVRRVLDDKQYAVKMVHSKNVESTRLRQDLLREIRVSEALGDHPHIVPVRFFRMIDGNLAVFSDYVDGGSLQNWIRAGKILQLQNLLDLAIQIAWGLEAVHRGGIIHKDIKPANILMETFGQVRVADFGLIRGMTPAYCSPEQMCDEPLTTATDIWSLALVVIYMWLGERKWDLGPNGAMALNHLKKESNKLGVAPGSLIDLLEKCLSNEPSERPLTALMVAESLKDIYREVTGVEFPLPDPPEIDPSTSSSTAGPGRSSLVDGMKLEDPRELVKRLPMLLDVLSMDVDSLIPEVRNPPDTFTDDLHVYLFLEDILKKVAAVEVNEKVMRNLTIILKKKAWLLFDSGDPDGSIESHREAVSAIEELILWHGQDDLWRDLASNYTDMAFCQNHLGRLDAAEKNIKRAMEAMKNMPDKHKDGKYYYDFQNVMGTAAIIQARQEKFDLATESFHKARKMLDLIPEPLSTDNKVIAAKGHTEFNIATHYDKTGKHEKAVVHFKNALEFQTSIEGQDKPNEQVFLATICLNLAIGLAQLAKYDQALKIFQRAEGIYDSQLKISRHPYIVRKYAHFLRNFGFFYNERENPGKAKELASRSLELMLEIFEKHGSIEFAQLIAVLYQDLASYEEQLGNTEISKKYIGLAEHYNSWTS